MRYRKKMMDRYMTQSNSKPVIDGVKWLTWISSLLCIVLFGIAVYLPDLMRQVKEWHPLVKVILFQIILLVITYYTIIKKR